MVMHHGAHRCRSSVAAAAAAAAAAAVAVALALAAATGSATLSSSDVLCSALYSTKVQLCEQIRCKPELHRTIVVLVYTILQHEQTSQSEQSAAIPV
jgi:hypothetical protein